MTDVLCVFGTRPELVKVAPVMYALRSVGVDVAGIATGQHGSLLASSGLVPLLAGFPGEALEIESDGSVPRFISRAKRALLKHFKLVQPRIVLVQGDTMSAYAGAAVAHELGIPVAHVEAGVRSGDDFDPWPEERFRKEIDRWATWWYAPTQTAWARLCAEDETREHRICAVGNTSIDALRVSGVTARAEASPTLLITLHRRELRDRADVRDVLQTLLDALGASGCNSVWPVHPGLEPLLSGLRIPAGVGIRPPMAHAVMLRVLSEARGVLTDSGGLVEEAAHLGVPTAIFRNANDRPEAVEAGIARRFAVTPSGAQDAVACLASCAIPRRVAPVYGDGHAAERIAEHLANVLRRR